MKENIYNFVRDFYLKAKYLKSVTTSFLTLITKIKHPRHLNEYMPICLIGCLYKILSKILASRLSNVIGIFVSKNHTTFVPNRNTLDGLLVVNQFLEEREREIFYGFESGI